MASASLLSLISIIMLIIQYVLASGFTTDLIHRDSPLSPYYNPSMSRSERLHKAFKRSLSRAAMQMPSGGIESDISYISGDFLMKLSIGTPPVETLAIADTASDLSWVQCKPCTHCFKETAHLFDPSRSSTYINLGCEFHLCDNQTIPSCDDNGTCLYTRFYPDRSHSSGYLANETFTFSSNSDNSSIQIPNVAFGCGHNNMLQFHNNGTPAAGIIGLGRGPLSIINQFKTFVNGKFSYCLVPIDSPANVTSKLKFGSDAFVSGPNSVSSPMVSKHGYENFYSLILEGVSVNDKRLPYMKSNVSSTSNQGNIIIDSGTILTILGTEFYLKLMTALEKTFNGTRTSSDSQTKYLLCYDRLDKNTIFPNITFHFKDADLLQKSTTLFLQVEPGTYCLTLLPTDDNNAILGNLSQMDYLVGYDLVANKVSFLPTDCTKQ